MRNRHLKFILLIVAEFDFIGKITRGSSIHIIRVVMYYVHYLYVRRVIFSISGIEPKCNTNVSELVYLEGQPLARIAFWHLGSIFEGGECNPSDMQLKLFTQIGLSRRHSLIFPGRQTSHSFKTSLA